MQSTERGAEPEIVGGDDEGAGVFSEIQGQNSWWEIWGRTPRKLNTFI